MKRYAYSALLLIALLLFGCDSNIEHSVFKYVAPAYSSVNESTDNPENYRIWHIHYYHENDIVFRQLSVEKFYYESENAEELISQGKFAFDLLVDTDFYSEPWMRLSYEDGEDYQQMSYEVDLNLIDFENIDPDLLNYIGGESALNKNNQMSYKKLKQQLLDLGFVEIDE